MNTRRSTPPETSTGAALLADVVGSRDGDRERSHRSLLGAIDHTNRQHPALDDLRPTVGDEAQGVYDTLGHAIAAAYALRLTAATADHPVDLRIGIGIGEVRTIDAQRNIQDGSAWWAAREAIETAETAADNSHFNYVRTHVIDARADANPLTNPTLRLIDAMLAELRPETLRTFRHLVDGMSNQDAAAQLGISAQANSQRVITHRMRTVAEAIQTLATLP